VRKGKRMRVRGGEGGGDGEGGEPGGGERVGCRWGREGRESWKGI
jgi:hypothetical protein